MTLPSTVHQLLTEYRRRTVSPVEVVQAHLDRIDRFDPVLNAFTVVDREGAVAAARRAESLLAAEADGGPPAGDLAGVPLTVKDIVNQEGFPCTDGSAVTSDEPAGQDCPSVARLREAGAVILGRTTTPEFGWKGMTDSPRFGITRNPWDLDHTPGGSSGGAAAALTAGIGVVAHGSDGGGSIRIPSSYCGLVGLKPTFGRVPQAPVGSPFTTLVAEGPLARTVEDAALLLNVLSRPDIRDWHAVPHDPRDWRIGINDGLAGLTVAYSETFGGAEVQPDVLAACRAVVDQLSDAGVRVVEVGSVIEPLRPKLEGYWKAGFASILNGIPSDRWDELDPGFRTLAQEGMGFDVHGMTAAQTARADLVETMRRFHLDHDVLLTPTMPTPPPPVDTTYHSAAFDRWHHAVPFTVPFNYSGQPAASVPAGFSASPALPIGLQVVATLYREDLVLRAARAILAITGWSWSAREPGQQAEPQT